MLTGTHPEYNTSSRFDEQNDQEKFGALVISAPVHDLLWKMLGHQQKQRYASAEEMIEDMKTVWENISANAGEEEVGIDLKAAQSLTQHRNTTKVPLRLQQRINGLKAIFTEKYSGIVHLLHAIGKAAGPVVEKVRKLNHQIREYAISSDGDLCLGNCLAFRS
ncbi:hypothetical protein HYX13_02425 [Candidatus Woesearchaeota archaeon]|nr:hypothetical protein [Candidatus Woesearchaeota archaeon]